jgi:spoIIIJ-associated protein
VRRKGEALDALQHIVNTAFRRDVDAGRRIVVDCLEFRKGKDRELKQMTRFLMDKVRSTGIPQEIGPLNSYARRLVHLEVSSEPDMASESQGDGAVKTVIISLKK